MRKERRRAIGVRAWRPEINKKTDYIGAAIATAIVGVGVIMILRIVANYLLG